MCNSVLHAATNVIKYNNNLFLHWGFPITLSFTINFRIWSATFQTNMKNTTQKQNMQLKGSQYMAIFSTSVRFQGAAGQSKAGFLTQGEKFPSLNVPCAYLGSMHPLHLPTMEFQALPPHSTSLQLRGQDSQQPWSHSTHLQQLPDVHRAQCCAMWDRVGKVTGPVKTKVELHHLSFYTYCNVHPIGFMSSQVCTRPLQK